MTAELHPDNAEALADLAREVGAFVLEGLLTGNLHDPADPLRLAGHSLAAILQAFRDRRIVLVLAAVGDRAPENLCDLCSAELLPDGACPNCGWGNRTAPAPPALPWQADDVQNLFDDLDRWLGSSDQS